MSYQGLMTALDGLDSFQALLQATREPGVCAVCGLADGERAFVAAALARRTGRPVVLISPSELIANRQAEDIRQLLGGGVAALPARELDFTRAAQSRESTWQRLGVLAALRAGEANVLCLSAEGWMDRLPPAASFDAALITLAEGDDCDPEALLDALVRNGYERVDMVEGQGQCARRGALVDVYPPNLPEAVRVELFGDQIDSLRLFDCISQRSVRREKRVVLAPATECLIPEGERAAAAGRLHAALQAELGDDAPGAESKPDAPSAEPWALDLPPLEDWLLDDEDALPSFSELALPDAQKAKTAKSAKNNAFAASKKLPATSPNQPTADEKPAAKREARPWAEDDRASLLKRRMDDVDRVAQGHPVRAGQMLLELLLPQTVTAADYLNDPVYVLDTPELLQSRANARRSALADELTEARRRGDGLQAQERLLWDYSALLERLQAHPVAALTDAARPQGRLQPGTVLDMSSTPVTPYQSQLSFLKADLLKWREAGYAIALLCGGEARAHRLERALAELDVTATYAADLPSNLIRGEALLLPMSLQKGFVHDEAKLAVVSDSDLYGSAYHRAKKHKSAGERIASFTDLKTGDYIVHDIHGVGQFAGIVQVVSEGVTRDYLLIQYAGADKLYVPTDQFDRVQRFIGAEQSAPKLNRLGGAEWQKQKSRVKAGLKTLAFDLAALYARRQTEPGFAFSHDTPWQHEFDEMFPYELTADQQESVEQIFADMEKPTNMDRLLCGDVGYGKTEVALRAAFKAVVEGKQVAILAPTTILVQQHFHTVKKRFEGFDVTVEMLSRFRTAKEQKEILARAKEGKVDILVGTHRLLAKDVAFHDLGLLIIDEEHRFGVSHKESIKNMKAKVDVLTLSATPIPRTLHMSMVGIRDMSLLESPPEERLPVKTYVLEYDDAVLRDAIKRELQRGGQVYFLYNRVRSIEQMYQRIKTLVPEARVCVAHGQMRENALEDVMLDFYAGAYDVLLCTTIIESGLDVPSANTLIVFDADHFGLSQLYQLRGRVGRSSRQAYAYFTVRRNKQLSETAEKRLAAIREFTEFGAGYRIAMRDLEIRGAGDVLGPEQHGHLSAVGYDMYLKLVEQSVSEAQGVPQTPELDTHIKLKLDAYLPESYIAEERLRIEAYKRIAMIQDADSRADITDELIDRYGTPPESVETLMDIAQLRALTRRLGASRLFLRADGVHLRIDESFLPDAAALLTSVQEVGAPLAFSVTQPPELMIRQPGLSAAEAATLSTDLLGRVLRRMDELTRQPE